MSAGGSADAIVEGIKSPTTKRTNNRLIIIIYSSYNHEIMSPDRVHDLIHFLMFIY